jgi:maltooligosyltrehalose trehalohydrolase
MDVVYNHLGPEGNYTGEFAPYVTADKHTPWGNAIDYARPEVRAWAIENAIMWRDEYRMDGLRLDAIQAIIDDSPTHVLAELTRAVHPAFTIAETDLNDVKVFAEWGFDAAWSDDFHHALHVCLTGERTGYYAHFDGAPAFARSIEEGWIRGPHPSASRAVEPARLIVSTQTHDQVGNRARGDRLAHLAGLPSARLAAVAMLAAAPGVPMIFMGEEVAASAPFQYFTSHGDRGLARAVSEGRKREFEAFAWQGAVPDPQSPATFHRSKVDREERRREPHAAMRRLYADLIALRRTEPSLGARAKDACRAKLADDGHTILVARGERLIVINLSRDHVAHAPVDRPPLLHSEDARYSGSLATPGTILPPRSAAIY